MSARRQLRVVGEAAARELTWGLPAAAHEVSMWRRMALAIPAPTIRADALSALSGKRGHIDGAALFCILPRTRQLNLLRLLVTYQIMFDFLDSVNEHGAAEGQANGHQLHRALTDALNPDSPHCDYYRYHPWRDDGGYLDALVRTCQHACRMMPSYQAVRPFLVEEARRAQVQAINHDPDHGHRDASLRAWARREFPDRDDLSWYELSGGASSTLRLHVLMALAAKSLLTDTEILRAHDAYFPWIDAATAMLDAYVDQPEDLANGDHSYIGHYPEAEIAIERVELLVRRAIAEVGDLRDGERHVLILACMMTLYLSKGGAWRPEMRDHTRRLLAAGGRLPAFLLPIFRIWRMAHAQRA